MKKIHKITASLAFLCTLAVCSQAEVRLASPFADHMVLQRDKLVHIWGWANPKEKVSVGIAGQTGSAMAAADGRWMVSLPKMKAGGPYRMNVKGDNEIILNDVYVGEVWVCSGQSNMAMTVAKEDRYWCGVYNQDKEVASANYPKIRAYTVEFATEDTEQDTLVGKWEVVSPSTVGHMSAAAYFFARELYQRYGIPVGLLVTTFGASTAQAWTSRDALQKDKDLAFLLDKYDALCDDYDSGCAMGRYQVTLAKWEAVNGKALGEKTDHVSSQDVNAVKPAVRKPGAPRNPHTDQHSPCVLWNAMVSPLVPYTVRGAIWYQGESNGGTAKIYDRIMAAMIKDWRSAWGQGDFPFIYVQIANRELQDQVPSFDDWNAYVREGQLKNLNLPNTGMVVAIDNANPENPLDVHPKNKQEIGRRLALVARSKAYGEKSLVYSGPIYQKMEIEGNKVRVYFEHVGKGLVAKGGKVAGFAIAGADGKFIWGDALIEGNSVIVSSQEIDKPVAVRYGFGRNPLTSLYNREGLPASPFRTDM